MPYLPVLGAFGPQKGDKAAAAVAVAIARCIALIQI